MPDDPLENIEKIRAQIRRLEDERVRLSAQLAQQQDGLREVYEEARGLMGLSPDDPVSLADLEAWIEAAEASLAASLGSLAASVAELNDVLFSTPAP